VKTPVGSNAGRGLGDFLDRGAAARAPATTK